MLFAPGGRHLDGRGFAFVARSSMMPKSNSARQGLGRGVAGDEKNVERGRLTPEAAVSTSRNMASANCVRCGWSRASASRCLAVAHGLNWD